MPTLRGAISRLVFSWWTPADNLCVSVGHADVIDSPARCSGTGGVHLQCFDKLPVLFRCGDTGKLVVALSTGKPESHGHTDLDVAS
jgi:hypothetical protein